MKIAKKLFYIALCGLYLNELHASYSDESFDSGITSNESFNSYTSNSNIKYFVEKPNKDGLTEYFEIPIVIKAYINKSKGLPWLKKKNPTITILEPIINTQETSNIVSLEDFIECDGPTRALDDNEYYQIYRQALYEYED